jgi:hypothetical protein
MADQLNNTGQTFGVFVWDSDVTPAIINNMIYNFRNDAYSEGVAIYLDSFQDALVYNNTIYNSRTGIASVYIYGSYGTAAINNLVQNTSDCFYGTFNGNSDYNISDNSDAPGAHSKNSTTVSFVDTTNKNFHLASTDTVAKNSGINLQSDTYFHFSQDIDGQERSGLWDIGADEFEAGTAGSVQDNVMTSGLVGHWTFDGDDVSGTTAKDVSGSGNNGTISGATSISGKLGSALSFDGMSNHINVDPMLYSIDNKLTVSYWANPNNAQIRSGHIARWDENNNGDANSWAIRTSNIDADEAYVFIADDYGDGGNNYFATSDLNLTNNQWAHISMVYDGQGATNADKLKLYKNGIQVNGTFTGTIPSFFGHTGVGTTLGRRLTSGVGQNYYGGSLDDVRIYDRALTTGEVELLYISGQVTANASQNAVMKNGLVGVWSFDGPDVNPATNTAYDRSGNGNNGTITGATPTIGKIGSGMSFNGVSSRVDMGDLFYSDAFSVCAWINANSVSGDKNIVVKRNNSSNNNTTNEWEFIIEDGILVFDSWNASDGSTFVAASAATLQTNTWYHVCGVQGGNGNTGYVYINGIQNGSGAQSSVMRNSSSIIQIGTRSSDMNTRYWDGKIDEVRIYNRALSSDEINGLYNTGKVEIRK